ncbi:PH domain-containing protein [Nesterenkonia ebinurensis]|uniref:PH domain-containing protein n=1 Tax=Nesterenkonia ebinurensis TaxID=2608252 RepID=UPI00123C7EB7|nr:PH domain-containing protein [Nesterenkonia ebinurensis]
MHSEAIDPTGVEWTRVDDKYITVRYISTITSWLITIAIVAAPVVADAMLGWGIPDWLKWPVLAVLLVWAVIDIVLVPRRVRAIGYFERADDLLIRRGILFQRVVAVPYGRLQYVDIEAGPLMRKFGLCTVQLKTASAATDATIPGAVRSEGARLRDELSVRGQARLAGL